MQQLSNSPRPPHLSHSLPFLSLPLSPSSFLLPIFFLSSSSFFFHSFIFSYSFLSFVSSRPSLGIYVAVCERNKIICRRPPLSPSLLTSFLFFFSLFFSFFSFSLLSSLLFPPLFLSSLPSLSSFSSLSSPLFSSFHLSLKKIFKKKCKILKKLTDSWQH